MLSILPEPPYFAVIFTSLRQDDGDPRYDQMAEEMGYLARRQPGFLGMDSARGADCIGITVSYWADTGAIARWKADAHHLVAQRMGQDIWYESYSVHIARIERSYTGPQRPD